MTKKLEELFNLEPAEMQDMTQEELKESMSELDAFDDKMKAVVDLTSSDQEMDDIAKKAMENFEELMTLGMNVDARTSAPIFEAATKLMGHALQAKSNKIDKKLRLMDIELKKIRLAHQMGKSDPTEEGKETPGEARFLDRNELLKLLQNKD